jgi:hypothetical protein
MTLKRGDIVLCSTKWSPVSWAIRKIEHCHWSHVAWVWNDVVAIEALAGGVVLTLLKDFDFSDQRKCKVVRIKPGILADGQLDDALAMGMGYVGREYDWKSIFRLAWAWAMKLRRNPIHNDRHRLICSEVVAMPLWEVAGFRFRDDIPAENTVPKDIAISDRVEAPE